MIKKWQSWDKAEEFDTSPVLPCLPLMIWICINSLFQQHSAVVSIQNFLSHQKTSKMLADARPATQAWDNRDTWEAAAQLAPHSKLLNE